MGIEHKLNEVRRMRQKLGVQDSQAVVGHWLRSAERLRALHRGEPLPEQHPAGDFFDVVSMQRSGGEVAR